MQKDYKKPPISILKSCKNSSQEGEKELLNNAKNILDILLAFNIRAKITDITQGHAVTLYQLQIAENVNVKKLFALKDNLKLALAASDINIISPIPGTNKIGIELPNKQKSVVYLKDMIQSKEFLESKSLLSFCAGIDINGRHIITDLANMPHLLIAGATGSGKSIFINDIIISLLYKAHPDDVKIIMIDPKVVELNLYNDIPHLVAPVVSEPQKAAAALQWAVDEMQKRYKKLDFLKVRNITDYNKKINEMKKNGLETPGKMPYLVILIDELADLMTCAGKEVEKSICRLAQLARSAGIHLIIATQRPSVNVITGLIKSNIPSRISFSVASGIDSRTILDKSGAEKLTGCGDMLYKPQSFLHPLRLQAPYISTAEIEKIVSFLKDQRQD